MSTVNHRILGAIAIVWLTLAGSVQSADWLVLRHATVIDGTGAPARKNTDMVIRDSTIIGIGQSAKIHEPQAMDVVTTIDLEGAFIMPGLIDSHVHVARFPHARQEAERILTRAVQGGVTGVRDLGGDARALAEILRLQSTTNLVFPSLVFSGVYGGPSLFSDQRIIGFARGFPPGEAPWARAITESSDLALVIAETKGLGATGIKIYANLDPAMTQKIIQEAQRQEMKTWAHGTVFPTRPSQLVDFGVDSLSHAPYLVWEAADVVPKDYGARIAGDWKNTPVDHPKIIALFDKMIEKGVCLDATLYVFRHMADFSPQVQAAWAKEAFDWGAAVTARARSMGVTVTTGTDWFEPANPGDLPHTHEEMALLVEKAGFTPMDAIVAGTRNGAIAMGMSDKTGTLEPSKAADLLILKADPLADIRNTTKILWVVKAGQLIKPKIP